MEPGVGQPSLEAPPATKRAYRMESRQQAVERTRERILQAAYDLWRERPYDEVTLDMVAAAAGVARQTVHRQFGAKDDLAVAVTNWVGPREERLSRETAPGDVASAVHREVERYERMGDANVRFVQMEGRIPAIDYALERGRAGHREWVEHAFGGHLPSGRRERERAVLALYAATDVMVWKLLRRDFGLSRAETEAVMRQLVEGVVRTIADKEST